MNYATQVSKPTAHITKKKSRLKVYNGHVVFLNDKDNFEFEIHNPKQKSVLCKIKLNGEYISTGGIVLKPCLLYTSPSPRDRQKSRMPSSA